MIGDKEEHFEGKGTDLDALQSHIQEFLTKDGFKVQTSPVSDAGRVIQAHKGGWLREFLADADHSLNITIVGTPADFTVRFGLGKWMQHLGTAVIETLLISELFLPVDVFETFWTVHIENQVIADVKSFVG